MHPRDNESEFSEIKRIAASFRIPEPFEVTDFPEKGNINRQAYLITSNSAGNLGQYILQRLNLEVLTQPRRLMESISACLLAQRRALSQGVLNPDEGWEVMTIIPTRAGSDYLEIQGEGGLQCWRTMVRIPNCKAYQSLDQIPDPLRRLKLAEQAGRGLALFGSLTADMDPNQMVTPVPGYRNTKVYYDQLFSILEGSRTLEGAEPFLPQDPDLRHHTGPFFLVGLPTQEYRRRLEDDEVRRGIRLAVEHQSFALSLFSDFQRGALPHAVVHGDTKLENFLFDSGTDTIRSLIDLDTIMPYTWLADWGDLVRSLVNSAGEKVSSPDSIEVDLHLFEAVARGFLRSARRIRGSECLRMVDAVRVLALELGVRFLTDYLRGDTYFRLDSRQPSDLNKVRALVQFALFERIRDKSAPASHIIESLCGEYGIHR